MARDFFDAGFFIAISLGIWLASRRLGLVALGWTVLVILSGKIITGQHTPLDVAAGAAVAVSELLILQALARRRLGDRIPAGHFGFARQLAAVRAVELGRAARCFARGAIEQRQ